MDNFENQESSRAFPQSSRNIEILPDEILLDIFKNLDLKSLGRCATVCRKWNRICSNQEFYENLYFEINTKINVESFLKYFIRRGYTAKRLCVEKSVKDQIESSIFYKFLQGSSNRLTHLDPFLICEPTPNTFLVEISNCTNLIDLRLHFIRNRGAMESLSKLTKLETLHLHQTNITDKILLTIFESNPNLRHFSIDTCQFVKNLEKVVNVSIENNLIDDLESWSSHNCRFNTSNPIIYEFKKLKNLNLHYCYLPEPEEFLDNLVPRAATLEKLVLCDFKHYSGDGEMFLPLLTQCENLKYLDLSCNLWIELYIFKTICKSLPKLKVLKLSGQEYNKSELKNLMDQYPQISFETDNSSPYKAL